MARATATATLIPIASPDRGFSEDEAFAKRHRLAGETSLENHSWRHPIGELVDPEVPAWIGRDPGRQVARSESPVRTTVKYTSQIRYFARAGRDGASADGGFDLAREVEKSLPVATAAHKVGTHTKRRRSRGFTAVEEVLTLTAVLGCFVVPLSYAARTAGQAIAAQSEAAHKTLLTQR